MIVYTVVKWLLVLVFVGAGLYNASGTRAVQGSFVSWGYPPWWCYITGLLEIVAGALIAVPIAHVLGLILGAMIIIAAITTVIWRRQLAHLPPLLVFGALLVISVVELASRG